MEYWCHHLGGKPRSRSWTEWHTNALIFLALPHERHVLAVGLADQEVHVEVRGVNLHHEIVAAAELSNSMKPRAVE